MKARTVLAAALVFAPVVASAQPGDTAGSAPPPATAPAAPAFESGWLLEVRYQQADSIEIIDAFGSPLPMPEPQGAVFAGYQRRRW